jgi:hypothetical protein
MKTDALPYSDVGHPKRVYRRAHASVRFFGSSLDPFAVTLALRLPADHTHRAGEPRLARTRRGVVMEYAPYKDGQWSMSSEPWVNSPRLAVHLRWLLDQLEPKKDVILKLRNDGIRADFFCFSSGTTRIPPSLPKIIRNRAELLGFEIQIDHYFIN